MSETFSRTQALDQGVLIDISDIAQGHNMVWPTAISQKLEDEILLSLPTLSSEEAIENAYQAALGHILDQVVKGIEIAGADPTRKTSNRLALALTLPWMPHGVLSAVLLILPDDAGKPCFSLLAPDELPARPKEGVH